jgi:Flp pilus assembly protein TadG
MQRLHRTLRDESGMSLVFIGFGMMAFLGASMLAIDVGMLMTSRNQAQNSADAGALAGAVALAFDDFNDHSATGPAVTSAITASQANQVMAGAVSVTPADIEFLTGTGGIQNRVRVTVYRTAARGNPLSTLIARYFGMSTADIAAIAAAEASPANAVQCPLPFTIPDRWREMNDATWDPNTSEFEAVDDKGVPVATPDIYVGPQDKATYTGYDAVRDKGMTIVLKADNGSKLAPSMYQVWDTVGGDRGSDDVRNAIVNCGSTDIMGYGDDYVHKPGMQTGPVAQGIEELIALDPDATWDEVKNEPVSKYGVKSPRIRAIPLFDPYYYNTGTAGGRNASLKFVNYLGFFIVGMNGNEVIGRVTPIAGLLMGGGWGPAPDAAFPVAIHLVQ